VTRRDVIKRGLLLGASLIVRPAGAIAQPVVDAAPASPPPAPPPSKLLSVGFALNGAPVQAEVESRVTLLDLLREKLGKPGAKKGCDHGQCGACTVLVDGRRVLSCLTLAGTVQHKQVTTIEGLAQGDTLHPLQAAFIEHDAFQCGYCTPGQLMSAAGFLKEPWPATPAGIREGMSGNLCRCGAYCGIVAAITAAREKTKGLGA
jgi:xanthine dehydrogenase YagT iron-sulfur-binding subunit